MSICFITASLVNESFGGTQKFILQLSEWLNNRFVKIVIISNSNEALVKSIYYKNGFQRSEAKSGEFYKMSFMPSLFPSILFTLAAFLKIIYRNKDFAFSCIHAQDVFISGFIGMLVHKLLKIPLIIHAHGPSPYLFEDTPETTKFKKILAKSIARIVVNNANLMIVTDSYTRYLFRTLVKKTPIVCIPTPINRDIYCAIAKNSIINQNPEDFTFGFIGRLSPQKNLCTLLDAYAKAKKSLGRKSKLVVVGDGPEKDALIQKVVQLKMTNDVIFTGNVTENEKLEMLKNFSVFLMPSIYEGCPIALLEAMACSKPIISSDIPSIRAVVKNNVEAILIDPKNIEEIEKAMLLLRDAPQLRVKLGENAKERTRLYDLEAVFGRILELYGMYSRLQ